MVMTTYRHQMIERSLDQATVEFRLRYPPPSLVDEFVVSRHVTEGYNYQCFRLHCERDLNLAEVILHETAHLGLSIDALPGNCERVTGFRRTYPVRTQ